MIMSTQDYIAEAERQLSNTTHYQLLQSDPTDTFANVVKKIVRDMFERDLITKHTKKFLTPYQPQATRFYLLPKIHRVGNPGRPIVSSNGAPTEKISAFVDHYLRPLVTNIPSYLKDTTDFLRRLQDLPPLPTDTLLVTLDLSTSIPHSEGIEACREALDTREDQSPPTADLCHLIETILTKNNFYFNDSHYLHIQGTAMGTKMAPSYANLLMGKLEQDLLAKSPQQPHTWWRFIDDVFMLWTHGVPHLEAFLEHINHYHHSIKFGAEWSSNSISFLDTQVHLEVGTIRKDLYCKPTDRHQYLQQNSCHPHHTKTSIPYSQSLRLRRICSQDEDFERRTEQLKEHLRLRGYHAQEVEPAIQRAASLQRTHCLQPRERERQHHHPPRGNVPPFSTSLKGPHPETASATTTIQQDE